METFFDILIFSCIFSLTYGVILCHIIPFFTNYSVKTLMFKVWIWGFMSPCLILFFSCAVMETSFEYFFDSTEFFLDWPSNVVTQPKLEASGWETFLESKNLPAEEHSAIKEKSLDNKIYQDYLQQKPKDDYTVFYTVLAITVVGVSLMLKFGLIK